MDLGIVTKYIYGLLRLGFVVMAGDIFSNTIRKFSKDIGGFTMYVLRSTFAGVFNFFRSIFGGGQQEEYVEQAAA